MDLTVTENHLEEQFAAKESQTPTPIAEFVARPDFPQCALHQFVEIGGYDGVVVDIVHNSIKVRSLEGTTKSYNFHTLRKLYGPRVEFEPAPLPPVEPKPKPEPEQVKREVIMEPDFSAPAQRIEEFTGRSDFPRCVFGMHVDIASYKGVVVEIVNRSLKVRSPEEVTRSYNADVLRKLYPKA